ncbi:MAG: ankyrin repeat domain-containing protein [Phycisphaerae bacterium]|nr:ankyrin repeat domain-containing protein [Phycisphaerae bacterium]
MKKQVLFDLVMVLMVFAAVCQVEAASGEINLYVNGAHGNDAASGKMNTPLKTLTAAIKRLPRVIDRDVTIHVAPGNYAAAGGYDSDSQCLELNRPMSAGTKVRIIGNTARVGQPVPVGSAVFDWNNRSSGGFLIVATQGHWTLENIQLGTRQKGQRRGIVVNGPALLELRDVRIHTAGRKGPGICARHGGRVNLSGRIELNEDLAESGGNDENFCRIEAEYGGVVKFVQGKGASLSLGNGNLSASYYGVIELGCEQAVISSWNYQSNPIAVNNSGRVDLHNTTTRVCARNPRNTPIGLEHDGHVLAEGARIIIDGQGNSNAIVLQKASSFFCNDVEVRGQVRQPLLAMSGSVLLVGIHGDLAETFASTCSSIIVEKCTGSLIGPFKVTKLGQIILPDGKAVTATSGNTPSSILGSATLPAIHRAAYNGHKAEITQLIKQGADVRLKGPNGWTPLHMAAMGGHRGISELLLSNGANIGDRDEKGRTATELAKTHGHNGLAAFLTNKEAGSN